MPGGPDRHVPHVGPGPLPQGEVEERHICAREGKEGEFERRALWVGQPAAGGRAVAVCLTPEREATPHQGSRAAWKERGGRATVFLPWDGRKAGKAMFAWAAKGAVRPGGRINSAGVERFHRSRRRSVAPGNDSAASTAGRGWAAAWCWWRPGRAGCSAGPAGGVLFGRGGLGPLNISPKGCLGRNNPARAGDSIGAGGRGLVAPGNGFTVSTAGRRWDAARWRPAGATSTPVNICSGADDVGVSGGANRTERFGLEREGGAVAGV
ncbi:MAG: hypothetical protein JNK54_10555 [Elusimicrobia bacterium]|nr:hypothetical protein [Elusimicrobiota bacterium]